MGDIENESLLLILLLFNYLLAFSFRISYYFLVFCTPYIIKSYSHLVEDEELVSEFLTKRDKYIFLNLVLFYFFSSVYLFLSIYIWKGNFILMFISLLFFGVLFFIVEILIKDIIFIGINKYLKLFPVFMGFSKLFGFALPLASFFSSLIGFFQKFFEQDIDVNKKYISEAIVYLDDFDWDDYKLEILEKFLSMDDTLIREIMVPRVDVVAFEANNTISEVTALIMKHGYSKYPVYEDSIDNIIGIVFLKDMLKYIFTNQGFIRLKDIARIPLIVPESKNIYELLNIMKQNRSSIAVVVDEYGGTSGIVTLTDLLQELLGKIHDEHDKEIEEQNIQKLSNNQYVVNPKIDIYTLEEYLGFDFPDKEDREYTTLSGLIYTKLGRIPKEGEVINIDNVILKILEIKKNKISKVLIKLE